MQIIGLISKKLLRVLILDIGSCEKDIILRQPFCFFQLFLCLKNKHCINNKLQINFLLFKNLQGLYTLNMKIMVVGGLALDLKHRLVAETQDVFEKIVRVALKRNCEHVFFISDLFLSRTPNQGTLRIIIEQLKKLIECEVNVHLFQGALSAARSEDHSF